MKNFVKALAKEGCEIQYLKEKFPNINAAKITSGIFNGPQIRQLCNDGNFDQQFQLNEKRAGLRELNALFVSL